MLRTLLAANCQNSLATRISRALGRESNTIKLKTINNRRCRNRRFRKMLRGSPAPSPGTHSKATLTPHFPKRVPAFQSSRRITKATTPTGNSMNSANWCIGPNNASIMLCPLGSLYGPAFFGRLPRFDFHSKQREPNLPPYSALFLFLSQQNATFSRLKVASRGTNCAEDTKLVGLTSSMILLCMRM